MWFCFTDFDKNCIEHVTFSIEERCGPAHKTDGPKCGFYLAILVLIGRYQCIQDFF